MIRLSETQTGKTWLAQFNQADVADAARLLDALRLIDDTQVSNGIYALLKELSEERHGERRRVALYAEREVPEKYAFKVEVKVANGIARHRAVGSVFTAIRPRRGQSRVGSEGSIASIVSQAVETWNKIYANHPGPDRFRSRRPIGAIGIVTDFIGSGTRVSDMLTKFWNVPSVKAWTSRGWLEFFVVAAAATNKGRAHVASHRTNPSVRVYEIVSTLAGQGDARRTWRDITIRYGPKNEALGFGETAALLAFSYRMPNNVPAILRSSHNGWRPLYVGAAPEELWPLFGGDPVKRIARAVEALDLDLASDLLIGETRLAIFLNAIHGRYRTGSEEAIAEMSGLPVPDVLALHRLASRQHLLDYRGYLTDAGRKAAQASSRERSRKTIVPTQTAPYYPQRLRIPRGEI